MGNTGNASYMLPYARFLAADGFDVAAVDFAKEVRVQVPTAVTAQQ